LYVTHDQDEAMALADRIAVMDAGRIVQLGSPTELYDHPATPHVAEFFGSINWIAGTVRELGRVDTSLGALAAPAAHERGDVVAGIRPEDVRLCTNGHVGDNEVTARVLEQTFFGDHRILRAQTADPILTVKVAGDAGDLAGCDVRLAIPKDRLHVFAAATVP
jgi:ABC-type sugar transport system ATPase subunit